MVDKFYSFLDKLSRWIGKTLVGFDVFAMSSLVVLIFIQVISRYIFNSSLTWSEELAKYIACWMIFLSSGYVLGIKEHTIIDLIYNRLPGMAQFILSKLFALIYIFFSYICIKYGYSFIQLGIGRTGSALPWLHLDWVYYVVPLSGYITMFYAIIQLLERRQKA